MNSFQRMIARHTGAHLTLSDDELKELEQRCNQIVAAHQRRFWIIMLLTVVATALIAALGGRLVGPVIAQWTGFHTDWCTGICAVAFAVATIAASLFILTRLYVRPLRRALSELGYEICESCGYWLRGLPPPPPEMGAEAESPMCPECGAPRTQFMPTK